MKTSLVGLHDSGKSTALAALWFSVTDNSDRCDWYLENKNRPSNSDKWTALRDKWLTAESLQRTKHKATPENLKLRLTSSTGSDGVDLNVPDIAGEDYQKLYEAGRFPKKHSDIIKNAEHLVFFIRVKDYSIPILADAPSDDTDKEQEAKENRAPQEVVEAQDDDTAADDNSDEKEATEWAPEMMHMSSKIVSVLRCCELLRGSGFPKLTVVLTAWDLIKDGSSPEQVLKFRFPLLDQYLRTNFDFSLFGLSAQGCDYDDSDALDVIDLGDITRIEVIQEDGNVHNDITKIFSQG
jgi:hypothetical protein